MDSGDENRRNSKQRRFTPRRQKRSHPPINPAINAEEAEAEEDSMRAARQIAQRIGIGQSKSKTETKGSSSQVTFQPDSYSLALSSFGGSDVNPSSSADIPPRVSSATAQEEVHNLVTRTGEDYVGPWDYVNTYYPNEIPWRMPNSGDPELLNQKEFGDVAKHSEYDENTINSAKELGLTPDQQSEREMFIFKLPSCLPVMKQSTEMNSSERRIPFEGLQEGGYMGKMQVYQSGKMKMKLGDVSFDVWKESDANILTDVAAIDSEEGNCTFIGSSPKMVTVAPDVESILKDASDKETQK